MRRTKAFCIALLTLLPLSLFPSLASASTYYTVQPGDTLWRISRNYGVTVEQIQLLNSLDTTLIYCGQLLEVTERDPGPEAPAEPEIKQSGPVEREILNPVPPKQENSRPVPVDREIPGPAPVEQETGPVPVKQEVSRSAPVSRGTGRTEKILDYAKSFIGVPYIYGGETPRGFDCSGYIQYVYDNFSVNLPRTAEEQYHKGTPVKEEEAKPGDLVAFKSDGAISHTGIYLGGGKFISSTSSRGVMISGVKGYYWGSHFYGFSRIMP